MSVDESRGAPVRQHDGIAESAPGLARIAFSAWLRTLEWSLEGASRAGSRLAGAAFGGEPGKQDEEQPTGRAYRFHRFSKSGV